MRVATIEDGSADGRLVVVSPDGEKFKPLTQPECKNLLSALQSWERTQSILRAAAAELETAKPRDCLPASACRLLAPLPRSFAFLDGSAFIEHVILARKARGAEAPADLESIPLMYQGISDQFHPTNHPIALIDQDFGLDFEAEFAIVTTFVPQAITAKAALVHIALIILFNDWTYRNLLPREASTGFGFIQSKPASSVAPFAATPDQLGRAWSGGKLDLDVNVVLNGNRVGSANGAEMHFSFAQLIAHAARTRSLSAGTILGSGTISNADPSRGYSCIAEKRAREILAVGTAVTPFLKSGDVVELSCEYENRGIFGKLVNPIGP